MITIPYQICPLCSGSGITPGGTFTLVPPCPVCKGEKVIPQYLLQDQSVEHLPTSVIMGEQRVYKGVQYTMMHFVNVKIGQTTVNCIAYFANDDPTVYYAREARDFKEKFKFP